MTQTECQQLADYWDIGSIQSIDIPETGTINTIRILTTDTGKFVLRVYQHHIRQRIETEHRVVAWVAEKGIPAVVPIRTRDGKDFVEDKGQEVSAIIDWDKVYTAPAAWEVVRALHLMLRFDLDQSITFLKAYQEIDPLSIETLDVVIHCYGLHRAYELWLFEEIYDHGNDRLRRVMYPGKFVPVADDWAKLRPKILEIL
jgi:Ser/Thr protein kinase RdoA (MazF antagonist)